LPLPVVMEYRSIEYGEKRCRNRPRDDRVLLLDDGPEEVALLIESARRFGSEQVKTIEQNPIKHGAFGMDMLM